MRSYGQLCSVAKALDVVGDRWTLLIIRELLVRGACRYTDLKNGLPGIATNLLADRIRELEAAGLVVREEAPPPVATTLVRLTEAGAELDPVMRALGWWGLRFMAAPAAGDAFCSQWFAYPVEFFLRDRDPDGPPASIELRTGGEPAVIEVSGGAVGLRVGSVPVPDLIISGPPHPILGLLTGHLSVQEMTALGVQTSGDIEVLRRVLPDSPGQPSEQPAR
jgi:DNA-binding HxlR family transcriptional regulator